MTAMRKTPKIYTDGSLLPGRAPGVQSSGKGLDSRARHGETHRTRMMQKLDIHRLADLVRFALSVGLSP
jgi:hypothetical protein